MPGSAPDTYEFDRVSPSSIRQFEMCPRRWFFAGPLNFRMPPTPALKYGTKAHRDVELVLKGERAVPETPEVAELMDRDLLPVDPEYIEQSIDDAGLELAGITLGGTLDAAWYSEADLQWVVNDWKFRSSSSYGNKTTQDIVENTQLNVYACGLAEMLDLDDHEYMTLQQTEVLKAHKGGPAARVVGTDRTVGEIRETVADLEHTVYQMREYAEAPLKNVPQNFDACFAYGKECPFKDHCHAVDHQPVMQAEEKKMVDNLDNLLNSLEGDDADESTDTNDEAAEPVSPDEVKSEPEPEPEQAGGESEAGDELTADDVFGALSASRRFSPEFVSELEDEEGLRLRVRDEEIDFVETSRGAVYAISNSGDRCAPKASTDDLLDWCAKVTDDAGVGGSAADASSDGDGEEKNKDVETNETDAPVTAPDQAPEEEPKDVDDILIDEWDWTQVPKVGDSKEDAIVEFFADRPYDTLAELLEAGFDFQSLPKVGDTIAANIREQVESEVTFEPEDGGGDGNELSARTLQKRLKQAREIVDREGSVSFDADAIDEEDVREADNAQDLAGTVMQRLEKRQAEAASSGGGDDTGDTDSTADEQDKQDEHDEHGWADGESSNGGLRLFINCHPVSGAAEPVHLTDLLERFGLYEQATDALNEQDDIDVAYWNSAPYAKGPKALAGAVLQSLDKFDGRDIVVHDDLPGAKEIIPALMSRATLVVKNG